MQKVMVLWKSAPMQKKKNDDHYQDSPKKDLPYISSRSSEHYFSDASKLEKMQDI